MQIHSTICSQLKIVNDKNKKKTQSSLAELRLMQDTAVATQDPFLVIRRLPEFFSYLHGVLGDNEMIPNGSPNTSKIRQNIWRYFVEKCLIIYKYSLLNTRLLDVMY